MWPGTRFVGAAYEHTHINTHICEKVAKERMMTKQHFLIRKAKIALRVFKNSFPNRRNSYVMNSLACFKTVWLS